MRRLALAALLLSGCATGIQPNELATGSFDGLWATADTLAFDTVLGPGTPPAWIRPESVVRFRQLEIRDSLLVRTLLSETDGELIAVHTWDRATEPLRPSAWTGERVTATLRGDTLTLRWADADAIDTAAYTRWTPVLRASDLVGRWIATITNPETGEPETVAVTFRSDGTVTVGEPPETESSYHVVGTFLVLDAPPSAPPPVMPLRARGLANAREIALNGDRMTWIVPEIGAVVFHRQPE